jgi:hypothetical protein
VKKTGINATNLGNSIENSALSFPTAKTLFAITKNPACVISELLELSELEIIYANIRV